MESVISESFEIEATAVVVVVVCAGTVDGVIVVVVAVNGFTSGTDWFTLDVFVGINGRAFAESFDLMA